MTCSTVFFPGAGSFGSEFQPLVDALKPGAWLVRYPGRYGKDFGVPAASFDAVVRACVEQIARRAPESPVLFGHSFGAYVAYAVARRLEQAGTKVSALVAVGASAPGRLTVPEQATSTVADAAEYLERIDPGALDGAPSDDWREIVAETTLHDMRLLARFDPASVGPLHCPVLAARGTADPLTSDATVSEWQQVTDGDFALRVLSGGHSDVLRADACVTWAQEIRDRFS